MPSTRVYRIALIIWNTAALILAVTSGNYDQPDALALVTITAIGNLIITGLRQILDGSTPTLPTGDK
jgi:hypothetical protein